MFKQIYRISLLLAAFMLVSQFYGCHSSTWNDAQQENTYASYQAYIDAHPKGKHLAQAKTRADSLYWASIKNDTTKTAFESYQKKFPEGKFSSQARAKINQLSLHGNGTAKAHVTGSGVIIRSDHTTQSASKGVVAKKGTIVQILGQYNSGNGNGAILKHNVTVDVHGKRIQLAKGKAIHILADHNASVKASFITTQFGKASGMINKDDIEAMGGQKWYKIHTHDGITGWIYGKFIKVM